VIDNVEIKNCATGIYFDTVYHTEVKASIIGSSSYGVYFTDDCQSLDLSLFMQDCATYFYGNDLRFSRVLIHATHDADATQTLARMMHLENGASNNMFQGYMEIAKEDPSEGDMIFIDESSYNTFSDMYFLNINGFDAYDTFLIGDSANTQCFNTIIRGCVFSAADAANYHVNIGYASYTVLRDNISAETNLLLKVNEPDYYAIQTRGQGILIGDQIETAAAYSVKTADSGKTINVDCTSSGYTMTLPRNTVSKGTKYRFRKIDSSSNIVTITVTGAVAFYPVNETSIYLISQYDWVEIENREGYWYILGSKVTRTLSLTPAQVATATTATETFTCNNIYAQTDVSLISEPAVTAGTLVAKARMSADNTVELTFANVTGGALTPASGDYVIRALY
jgi:hypothetical protein